MLGLNQVFCSWINMRHSPRVRSWWQSSGQNPTIQTLRICWLVVSHWNDTTTHFANVFYRQVLLTRIGEISFHQQVHSTKSLPYKTMQQLKSSFQPSTCNYHKHQMKKSWISLAKSIPARWEWLKLLGQLEGQYSAFLCQANLGLPLWKGFYCKALSDQKD